MITVGAGTNGAEHIAPKAGSRARANNVSLLVQLSQDAAAQLKEATEQKKKVASLTHITC